MGIGRAVITGEGLGARLLPMSKELPRKMLSIYAAGSKRNLILKPILQAFYEQLYQLGIEEFCFVVGRGKRAIEDRRREN